MSDREIDVESFVDTAAGLLGIDLTAESRPVVISHFEIAANMAQFVMEFPLPDEAEPAPVYTP